MHIYDSITDRGNFRNTENPGIFDDPPTHFSKSTEATDFSPELFVMIFRDASQGVGRLCPRKSYYYEPGSLNFPPCI